MTFCFSIIPYPFSVVFHSLSCSTHIFLHLCNATHYRIQADPENDSDNTGDQNCEEELSFDRHSLPLL